MKLLIKISIVGLLAVSALQAQAPRGPYRIRYSQIGNHDQMFRRGAFVSQQLAGIFTGQTVSSLFGNVPTATMGASTSSETADPTPQAGWLDFTDNGGTMADYLLLNYNAVDDPVSQMYIHFVASPAVQGGNMTVAAKWTGGGYFRSFLFYFGQDQANSSPACYILQDNGQIAGAGPTDLANTQDVFDAWACVANGSTIQVYKNGRPSGQPAGGYDGTINQAGPPTYIGAIDTGAAYCYRGAIAFFHMGNKAPTPRQVWDDYVVLKRRMTLYGISLP